MVTADDVHRADGRLEPSSTTLICSGAGSSAATWPSRRGSDRGSGDRAHRSRCRAGGIPADRHRLPGAVSRGRGVRGRQPAGPHRGRPRRPARRAAARADATLDPRPAAAVRAGPSSDAPRRTVDCRPVRRVRAQGAAAQRAGARPALPTVRPARRPGARGVASGGYRRTANRTPRTSCGSWAVRSSSTGSRLRVAPRERDLRTVLRGADGAEAACRPTSRTAARPSSTTTWSSCCDLEWWRLGGGGVRGALPRPRTRVTTTTRGSTQAFLDEVVPAVERAVTKETAR